MKWGFWGLIALIVLGAIFYLSSVHTSTQLIAAQVMSPSTGREAKLLENTGLKEFDPSNDVKDTVSPDAKAMYKEVSDAMQLGGDLTDKSKVQQALTALNGLVQKYPDYADLYVMRVIYSLILGNTDYSSINADLDNALKYRQSTQYLSAYDSDAPIYLLKAKVATLSGNTKTELDDFQAAVDADPSNVLSSDFFDTGAVSPNAKSNPTAPTLTDFNQLIQVYPSDSRAYMMRGLFYASFTTFSEQYYTPATNDLKKSIALNPKSAEANYILGELYMKTAFWTQAAASDISDLTGTEGGYKDQQRNIALTYFNQATATDPNYKWAYGGAAEANVELKNYPEAIQAYTSQINLDSSNAGAYNDRGLAEIDIDQFNLAIDDLQKAIQLKSSNPKYETNGLIGYDSYQSLGDVYSKNGDYEDAVNSYSKAIGIDFASQVFLMSVDKIRAIYPEFSGITDQDLLEGLRQKYFPNMTSTDFNSEMVKNKSGVSDFILSDLYAARGDAYAKAGNTKKAAAEYARAMANDPEDILNTQQQAIYEGL